MEYNIIIIPPKQNKCKIPSKSKFCNIFPKIKQHILQNRIKLKHLFSLDNISFS